MRVEKKGRWKGVLVALVTVALLLCTYLTLSPGNLFLPGLGYSVCSVAGADTELRTGSAAVVRLGGEPYAGALVLWRDGERQQGGRVAEVQDGQVLIAGDEERLVDKAMLTGNVKFEIFVLGAVIDALSGQPGRYLVWAADALYVCGWCVWGLTLPARRRRQRKAELIRLFEQYGAKYDLEEEGMEY